MVCLLLLDDSDDGVLQVQFQLHADAKVKSIFCPYSTRKGPLSCLKFSEGEDDPQKASETSSTYSGYRVR